MNATLTEQEQQYLLQTLMRQPLAEALPIFLKLTGQELVPKPARPPDNAPE